MLLIREIMHCKPGKVRPMVDKFLKMSALNEKAGGGKMRRVKLRSSLIVRSYSKLRRRRTACGITRQQTTNIRIRTDARTAAPAFVPRITRAMM
jgi:hypothetical protein